MESSYTFNVFLKSFLNQFKKNIYNAVCRTALATPDIFNILVIFMMQFRRRQKKNKKDVLNSHSPIRYIDKDKFGR